MLTEHGRLAGTMPTAWTETAHRVDGDHVEATRFKLVCDEINGPLGAVTERYALVQNRELVAALDVAASQQGLTVEPVRATYRNGRASYRFAVPDLEFRANGDTSLTQATIDLRNDYRGSGGLHIMSGWYRLICTNGLVVGVTAHKNLVRHTGTIDVYTFVADAVAKLRDEFEVQRVMAETLAAQRYHAPTGIPTREESRKAIEAGVGTLVDTIISDTAERYVPALAQALWENERDMGPNLWAVTQAVAEVSTHRMRGFAADEWATRQLRTVREFAGV